MLGRFESAVRFCLAIGAVLLLVVAAGCGDETGVATNDGAADSSPTAASTDDLGTFDLATANAAFAFSLYRAMQADEGNIFLSPYSVSAALAMALVGAHGETADQMADVLGFDADFGLIPTAFRNLDGTLNARAELPETYEGEGFALHVVNALWPQTGYPFQEEFVGTLSSSFGAELKSLDYTADPEAARQTINDWVSAQTEERIRNLLPEGSVDEGTRLVLTNAIYFNAPWLDPFLEESTTTEPFMRLDETPVGVEMMHRTDTMLFASWEGGQALELPYNGNELAMVILVPDGGAFEAFDASITIERFDEIVASLETRMIALGLPKFEYEDAISLVPYLQSLGMTDAFDGQLADFSGITGEKDLAVSDVLHKAFVSVDEEGTEAAAATAVLFRATGIPAAPLQVAIDRPFLFVIRDRETGSILFIGRVLDPSA